MVYFPTSSPVYLIEFELIAFKNALAKSSSKGKTILIFPNGLDPVINRLIRFMASRMHLESMLISDYRSEVVVVYPESYFREEHQRGDGLYTQEDFLREKSLGLLDLGESSDQKGALVLPPTRQELVTASMLPTDNYELRSKAEEAESSGGECSSTSKDIPKESAMPIAEARETPGTSAAAVQCSEDITHDCLILSNEVMDILIPSFPNMFAGYVEGTANFSIKEDLEMNLPVNVYVMTVKEKLASTSQRSQLEEDDEDS